MADLFRAVDLYSDWDSGVDLHNADGIVFIDGRILGKMGHSERKGGQLYKNIPDVNNQDIFVGGVGYFK